jgi:hypothetical protein
MYVNILREREQITAIKNGEKYLGMIADFSHVLTIEMG